MESLIDNHNRTIKHSTLGWLQIRSSTGWFVLDSVVTKNNELVHVDNVYPDRTSQLLDSGEVRCMELDRYVVRKSEGCFFVNEGVATEYLVLFRCDCHRIHARCPNWSVMTINVVEKLRCGRFFSAGDK